MLGRQSTGWIVLAYGSSAAAAHQWTDIVTKHLLATDDMCIAARRSVATFGIARAEEVQRWARAGRLENRAGWI